VIVIFHTQAAPIMPGTTRRIEAVIHSLGVEALTLYRGSQVEAEIVDA
jgi:hypothetical protein